MDGWKPEDILPSSRRRQVPCYDSESVSSTKLEDPIGNRFDVFQWNAIPIPYSWSELTAAADHVDPADISSDPEQQQPNSLSGAIDFLIHTSKRKKYRKGITCQDLDGFKLSLQRAKQHLSLHFDYLNDISFVKHDSSVKELMRALPDFPLIEKWEKKILLKKARSVARRWHKVELCHEFALFLPSCDLIDRRDSVDSILKKLATSQHFQEKFGNFLDLRSPEVASILRSYLNCLGGKEFLPGDSPRHALKKYVCMINDKHQQAMYTHQKQRKTIPPVFRTSCHFLAHKEQEGWLIQHLILEITKLRAYFNDLPSGIDFDRTSDAVPSPCTFYLYCGSYQESEDSDA